ncbi:sporulation protein [Marinicrinis sediminis]|uniref:Sporulation protein n=1 Tax=Marinicrinis sediminis TaxID=1652465 RepID=A0ABW5R518_9BACL
MSSIPVAYKSHIATLLISLSMLAVVCSIVIFPERSFEASLSGLNLWWKLIMPALLPFFILAEVAGALGVFHAWGTLISPLTKRLLGLSGTSGWAMAFGWSLGYPAGAKITAELKQQGWIGHEEGKRLLAYSYVASPIVLFGIVATGLLNQPHLGWYLWLIQCLAFLGMLLFSYTRPTAPSNGTLSAPEKGNGSTSLLSQMLHAAECARRDDGRSLGRLLGDSVTRSVQALFMIGGTIMLFSVIVAAAEQVSLSWMAPLLSVQQIEWLQSGFHLILAGTLEPHLASASLVTSSLPIAWQLALVSAIWAWGGLAFHAQVHSFIQGTGLPYRFFFFFKLLQALLALGLGLLLWKPYTSLIAFVNRSSTALVLSDRPVPPPAEAGSFHIQLWELWGWQVSMLASSCVLLAVIGWLCHRLSRSRQG